MNIRPTVRPLPYYTVSGTLDHARLARSLRAEFTDKVARRLPGHHLGAFRHDTVIKFVKRHKKRYSWFLRTDISKFYPSVRHADLVTGMQIAYRDLLGLEYVPREFKQKYLGAVSAWCKSLPLTQGIPLGSPLSAILAPVMLLPLWLEIKRRYGVPVLVYMDDVLVLCEDEQQCAEIYATIENRLARNFGLALNASKTVSGQFSRQAVTFCGWRFSGGYAAIADEKQAAFTQRIAEVVKASRGVTTGVLLKRLNHKIDGYGNYYKHGDVARQFAQADAMIRTQVRRWLVREGKPGCNTNEGLQKMGLHSLASCYEKIHDGSRAAQPTPQMVASVPHRDKTPYMAELALIAEYAEKITSQLTQIVALQRKQFRMIQSFGI